MSDEGFAATRTFLGSLLEQRDEYEQFARRKIAPLFKRRDRKPPPTFQDSSFLYVRSFDGDDGARPFSGQVFWLSPDITIHPISDPAAYTRTLDAGETYGIRVALRNRGDLAVPSAKMELFLTDPTLGFDTRLATNLTLGGVPTTWVGSGATSTVDFTYAVPPTESGHKCLFARTFSFAPLELPVDDHLLDPRIDRHVAQLNLTIVGQSEAFHFGWLHHPNAKQRLEFIPMERDELMALRHPIVADVKPVAEFPRRGRGRLAHIAPLESAGQVELEQQREGFTLIATDRGGMSLKRQRELRGKVDQVLRAVNSGETTRAEYRELFAEFGKMNAQARRSRFSMTIPDLGLEEGEAVGVHVRAVDEVPQEPEVVGGITLVIVGE